MNGLMVQASSAVAGSPSDHPGSELRVLWAARITDCWRSSVQGIIRTGHLLIEAKDALPHGEFGAMCERDLPFGDRTAQRLMAIGSDIRLSNPTHVSLLPASWGTLAELTKLSDDEFSTAVQQNIIRPDMIRADVDQIRALTRPQPDAGAHLREGRTAIVDAGHNGPVDMQSPHTEEDHPASPDPLPPQLPSGGLAIAHQRVEPADSLDFFPTPPWATRALFEHVFAHMERKGHCKFQSAWEPACGEGHMAEVMREYFREVRATDVEDYRYGEAVIDFLHEDTRWFPDWIITNPPFNDSAEFVLKALELAGTGVAMFVRLAWLESVGRYEKIFRDHPPTQLAIFTERVPLHKGRWENDGTTMTAYIWLVWIKGAEPRAPFWIPPGCRERLSRSEDVKRFGKSVVEGEAA